MARAVTTTAMRRVKPQGSAWEGDPCLRLLERRRRTAGRRVGAVAVEGRLDRRGVDDGVDDAGGDRQGGDGGQVERYVAAGSLHVPTVAGASVPVSVPPQTYRRLHALAPHLRLAPGPVAAPRRPPGRAGRLPRRAGGNGAGGEDRRGCRRGRRL